MGSLLAACRSRPCMTSGASASAGFTPPSASSRACSPGGLHAAIGFDGLLMGDDVSMGALSGSIAERARASLSAGCDLVLHCNGKLDEMRQVAAEAPELAGDAARRATAALAARKPPAPIDLDSARREFAALI